MRKVRAVAIGASSAGVVVPPDLVSSVFGRVGAVVAVAGDYNTDQITNLSGFVGATATAALNAARAQMLNRKAPAKGGPIAVPAGTYNEFDLSAYRDVDWLNMFVGGNVVITGFIAPAAGLADNRLFQLTLFDYSTAADTITLMPLSGGSGASNRIVTPNRAPLVLKRYESAWLWYDGTQWMVLSVAQDAAQTTRTINTTAPLTGGGDLSADRTLAISAASGAAAGSMSAADFSKLAGLPSTAPPTSRAINTTAPLTGGGDLSADRTLAISDFVASGASHAKGAVPDPGAAAGTTKFLREDATWQVPAGGVPTSRAINTTAPITGGGDLSADRTLAISPASGAAAGSMSAADFSKLAAGGWPMSKFDTTHSPTLLYNFNDVLTDGSGNGNTLALALGTTRFVDFMTGYNPMRAVILGTGAGAFTATVAACRVTGDFTLEALMRVSYTEVVPASNAWFQCAGNGETSALNALWNVSSLDTTSILRARMFWENDTPSPGSNVVYDPDLVIPGPGVPFVLGVTRISDVVTFYINGVARATSGTLATAAGGGSSVVVLGCNDALALLGPMLHCASFKWIPSGLSAAQILAETKLIYGVA